MALREPPGRAGPGRCGLLRAAVGVAGLGGLCLLAACVATAGASRAPALSPDRIAAILSSPERSAADRANDVRRKPAELLAFIDPRPGMTVLDVSAGGGYTTELLARSVGPGGRVYGQSALRDPGRAGPAAPEGVSAPPASGSVPPAPTGAATASASAPRPPPRTSAIALGERAARPGAGNIVAVVQKFENPVPAELADQGLDLVTLMFNYHDLGHMGVDRAQMNAALFRALKPGGAYVIADHAGRPGTGISEAGTLHRIEEAFLRREVEAAGFRLAAEGAFLRNPSDPRDRNTPEPAQPKDDFVLKFVRP